MTRPLPIGVALRLWFYRIVFPIVLVFLLPGMVRRMVKRGNFRRLLGQRFGLFSAESKVSLRGKKTIWLQSISVGETQVALKLARCWHQSEPDLQFVISVTTSTGFDLASRSRESFLHVIYNPIDLASIVRRTLDAVDPVALVLVEGTWPVLLAETWRRNIPVSLIARLSPRSARRFARFRWFAGPIFGLLDNVFVQEPEEIFTWQNLGARSSAINCTGSIKYDEPPFATDPRPDFRAQLDQLGVAKTNPILVAGSTFAGEEMILAQTLLELRKTHPDLFLIIVPRHVERTAEILAELAPLNLKIALRSEPTSTPSPNLLLVNTTGELRDWYAFATVVFIGKSLTSTGGQNPVEPALLGKPVIFGPHMENFAPIVRQWLQTNAAIQVADANELTENVSLLLTDSTLRQSLSTRALTAISIHFGATQRVIDHLSSPQKDSSTDFTD